MNIHSPCKLLVTKSLGIIIYNYSSKGYEIMITLVFCSTWIGINFVSCTLDRPSLLTANAQNNNVHGISQCINHFCFTVISENLSLYVHVGLRLVTEYVHVYSRSACFEDCYPLSLQVQTPTRVFEIRGGEIIFSWQEQCNSV